jgi:hypothetical protein
MPEVPSLGLHHLYRALDRLVRPDGCPQELGELLELLLEVFPIFVVFDFLEDIPSALNLMQDERRLVRVQESLLIEQRFEPDPVIELKPPEKIRVVI